MQIKDMNNNLLRERIAKWLLRKKTSSSVRRVADLSIAIATDIGSVRKENQDQLSVLYLQYAPGKFFVTVVLCDGMGGMTAGAECAAMAVASFLTSCVENINLPLKERVLLGVENANSKVYELFNGSGGATLSAVMYDSADGTLGLNVGDSRIYSYGNGDIKQLTVDDTIAGQVNVSRNNLIRSNELLQFIGMGADMLPHIIDLRCDDSLFVLTSDGVHYLEENILKMTIHAANDPALAVKRLVDISKWCGGHDNASIAIVSPSELMTRDFSDLGVMYLWDSFGELQIYDTIVSGVLNPSPMSNSSLKRVGLEKNIKEEAPPEQKKRKDGRRKKKENPEDVEKLPQLKIDFNDEEEDKPNG